MDHLRRSGRPADEQRRALEEIIRAEPVLMQALTALCGLGLDDSWIVAGAIYNTVWNVLTDRPPMTGVKDIDVFYFEGSDLSYEAEDAVIRRAEGAFAGLPVPVEVRNQARVHLWFEDRIGVPLAPLGSSLEMLPLFAAKTHAVAVRLTPSGALDIVAPFGLDDIFSFRVVPNPALDNRRGYTEKAARAAATWPELTVEPWPGSADAADDQPVHQHGGDEVRERGERGVGP